MQPSVQEQQIIRDLGEDFNKRVKRAVKCFDSIVSPLKLGIRSVIQELFNNFVPVEDELKNQLINTCYYHYFTKFEDVHFRFLLQSLNFLFEPTNGMHFAEQLNYKYIAVIYMEQIRCYIKDQQPNTLGRLWERLNLLKSEKERDEVEEGFWDAYEETEIGSKGQIIKGKRMDGDTKKEDEFCHTKKEMMLKDLQIQALQTRLSHREQNLLQITAGYLKDLQNLREQLYRKESTMNSYSDSYEVSYMDFTEVLDPTIKQLLQTSINDLRLQFEKRTIDYVRTIEQQRIELQQNKSLVLRLQNQLSQVDAPSELLHKLFNLESNPYRIWKYIQDIKGNNYFKEVFEIQKAVYGINYKEVNQLMMTSKAYEREFLLYKEQVMQEMHVFFEKTLKEVECYKIEAIQAKQNKEKVMDNQSQQRVELFQETIKIMEQKQQAELLKQRQYYEEQLNEEQTMSIDGIKLKYMLKLWATISQLKKRDHMNNIQQILVNGSFIPEQVINLKQTVAQLQQQLAIDKEYTQQLTYKYTKLKQDYDIHQQEYNHQRNHWEDLQTKVMNLQQLYRQSDASKQIVEQFMLKLIRLIDPKMSNLKVADIDLDDKNRESIKSFLNSIKHLSTTTLRTIKEIMQQNHLNQEAYNAFIANGYNEVGVQTELADIRVDIGVIVVKESTVSLPMETIILQTRSIEESNVEVASPVRNPNRKPTVHKTPQIPNTSTKQTRNSTLDTKLAPSIGISTNQFQPKIKQTIPSINPNQMFENVDNLVVQEQLIKESKSKLSEYVNDDIPLTHRQVDKQTTQSRQSQMRGVSMQQDRMNKTTNTGQVMRDAQYSQPTSKSINITRDDQRNKKINTQTQTQAFQRLYEDSLDKQERIKALKENLELLEKQHWEDILSLFSKHVTKSIYDSESPPITITDKPVFKYQEGLSFLQKSNREYYQRVKSRPQVQEEYRNWIKKQTGCINRMFIACDDMTSRMSPMRLTRTADISKGRYSNIKQRASTGCNVAEYNKYLY